MLRNGYPERAAMDLLRGDPTVRAMRAFDRAFLAANAGALEHYASRWVPDPMNNWSRPFEYLYTYERILAFAGRSERNDLRVLDAGSGLTFFPHFLLSRHREMRVICVDSDARLIEDATRLVAPALPGSVAYRAGELQALDPSLGTFDLIYCISVLEHVAGAERAISGFVDRLRPGGRLVLTIDVAPAGDAEIPVEAAAELVESLARSLAPEGDPLSAVNRFDRARHYTTEDARREDPSLLPWAPPRFHLLTSFAMTFHRRN